MKTKWFHLPVLGFLLAFGGVAAASAQMHVTSPAFQNGGKIPDRFTCKGANKNPPLGLEGIPKKARSVVFILDDPDAPGGTFNHWLIWNINPATTQIDEGSTPAHAVEGTNDFGKRGYGGPCPPSGTHRYYFRVFALDRPLELGAGAKRAELDRAMRGHVLARGELMGRVSH